jgi:hypothetical protein
MCLGYKQMHVEIYTHINKYTQLITICYTA